MTGGRTTNSKKTVAQSKPDIKVPDTVVDTKGRRTYKKGDFLGKGGFAKCYELIDVDSKIKYAGKVIGKSQLTKTAQREKMSQEIDIHRSISHKHIVKFYSYFEDKDNIYIILELCTKKSMMELHRRRRTLTEPEIRYFVRQIALACLHLHENMIIHRDLKLGNIFINDTMDVKLGDFGLATRVDNESQRKYTLCGTPNYLAPEILLKCGHSYQVDVWSLGCIVYTLAVGKPPFETTDLQDTYKRIKHNQYEIPATLGRELSTFIEKMLRADPKERPTMTSILNDPYLVTNYIPRNLPTSCLTTAPRNQNGRLSIMPPKDLPPIITGGESPRRPLNAVTNTDGGHAVGDVKNTRATSALVSQSRIPGSSSPYRKRPYPDGHFDDVNLRNLIEQLTELLGPKKKVIKRISRSSYDAEDPKAAPMYWISKWVDFSDRYGLGYALCDDSYCVLFNDQTRLIMLATEDENQLQYVDAGGGEHFFKMSSPPKQLRKKVDLLKYFRNYMAKYLANTGAKPKEEEGMTRLPYVVKWFRTKQALIFYLTNGTLQVHFFDHIKLMLCPLLGAVTYVDSSNEFRTFRFDLMMEHGATNDLFKRLHYVLDCARHLADGKTTAKPSTAAPPATSSTNTCKPVA
ncbi:Serine/threonine-protein kinase PLK1, partial [Fragariocoptes setiger]